MIYSMTAFARQLEQSDLGNITWEIRTVNHRYLDCSFKMPENFKSLEMSLRELVREKVQRGRVECTLQYKVQKPSHNSLSIDKSLVQSLAHAVTEVQQYFSDTKTVSPLDVLAWPNVLQVEEDKIDAIHDATTRLFKKALDELAISRAREGAALQNILAQKLLDVNDAEQKIRKRIPHLLQIQCDKINLHFKEIIAKLDPQRLEKELVLLAQKIDISEELDRLAVHIGEMQRILSDGGCVGKRLDFLLQEFNRETNTIASKSVDAEITSVAIELKVVIEQIREQVQNIE